ncbi:hypothetical protein [Nodularia sp. LEGE 04288]|uniref:hypothetical protein n=1 Tax=Nodularia sp. LEGE 04288 TaxID=1828639 RepID=UPI001D127494|nr:hypothetical protein [Nodularia sp. LEGE 04288]MCC2691559.1 hypothetical protein [Nodularia sp. LEGE 04288]
MNREQFKDFVSHLFDLITDLASAEKFINDNDSKFSRRTYTRTLFATIDGTICVLKQIALIENSKNPGLLQDSEIKFLESKRQPTKENVKDTIKIVEKIFIFELLEINGKEWGLFCQSIDMRNEVTHPKNKDKFVIDDDQIQIIRGVGKWYLKLIVQILEAIRLEDVCRV